MRFPVFLVFLISFPFFLYCNSRAVQTQYQDSTEISKKVNYYYTSLKKAYSDGNYNLHKTYSDSLLAFAKENHLLKMQINALINQAIYFNNRTEHQKSIVIYHDALQLSNEIKNDKKVKGLVLVNMGNTYYNMGSYEKAINAQLEVLEIADNFPNSENVKAAAYLSLSNSYAELDSLNKALTYAKKVKTIGENIENQSITASALNNISDLYYQQKKYEKAIQTGELAINFPYLQQPNKKRASTLLNLGVSHNKLGNVQMALTYLKEANKIAVEAKIVFIEMHSQEHLAEVYTELGDYKKAAIAQKRYSELNNIYLQNTKEAIQLDLKKDLDAKDDQLQAVKNKNSEIDSSNKHIIFWSMLFCVGLGGALFFYVRQKKKIQSQNLILQQRYTTLQKTISDNKKNISNKITVNEIAPYKNSSLTENDRIFLKNKILKFMEKEKPYLDQDMNQKKLANKLEISSHHLSEVLHFSFEQNFYNFINFYRVMAAQELIKNNLKTDSKVLKIAFESGFKSKTSFNRVFKNYTGLTPSQYKNAVSQQKDH